MIGGTWLKCYHNDIQLPIFVRSRGQAIHRQRCDMPYDDVPIAHVLNFWLADAFDASDETDVVTWLGKGKTLTDMLGPEASQRFYTPQRIEELALFIHSLGLITLQYYMNNEDAKCAVVVSQGPRGELVFAAGNPEGTPAIMTDWFKRDREALLASLS